MAVLLLKDCDGGVRVLCVHMRLTLAPTSVGAASMTRREAHAWSSLIGADAQGRRVER